MYRGWFDKPVPVVFPSQPGVTYNVSSVFQAVDILVNKWPTKPGPMHFTARKICLAAAEGFATAQQARIAFAEAAEEAGILMR